MWISVASATICQLVTEPCFKQFKTFQLVKTFDSAHKFPRKSAQFVNVSAQHSPKIVLIEITDATLFGWGLWQSRPEASIRSENLMTIWFAAVNTVGQDAKKPSANLTGDFRRTCWWCDVSKAGALTNIFCGLRSVWAVNGNKCLTRAWAWAWQFAPDLWLQPAEEPAALSKEHIDVRRSRCCKSYSKAGRIGSGHQAASRQQVSLATFVAASLRPSAGFSSQAHAAID